MASVDFTRGRRVVYRFLSTLLRDEVSRETWDKLRSPLFVSALQSASERLTSADLNLGFSRIASFLQETDPDEGYNSLRYEYADIFLNFNKRPNKTIITNYAAIHIGRLNNFYAFTKLDIQNSDRLQNWFSHVAVLVCNE
jgi:hypothetical protein